jgi:hypothetical protein
MEHVRPEGSDSSNSAELAKELQKIAATKRDHYKNLSRPEGEQDNVMRLVREELIGESNDRIKALQEKQPNVGEDQEAA